MDSCYDCTHDSSMSTLCIIMIYCSLEYLAAKVSCRCSQSVLLFDLNHVVSCPLSSIVDYFYWSSIFLMTGLTVTPNLIPPSEVLSSNPAIAIYPTHYNLNTGAAFNISCFIAHSIDAFTVYFYKDGVVISDGDLVNTTLIEIAHSSTQKCIQLQFLNFQPVHDGVYHCFVNTSDTMEEVSSDLYLYGSGEDCLWCYSIH